MIKNYFLIAIRNIRRGSIKTSVMDEGISANCIPVEKDYIKALNIQLIAGRDFNDADQEKSTQDYQNDSDFSMIINETAAKIMGWSSDEAIGQRLERPLPGNIVGVVKDYHYAPMQEKIGPLVMMCLDMYHQMLIKIDSQESAGTIKSVEKEWEKIAPPPLLTILWMKNLIPFIGSGAAVLILTLLILSIHSYRTAIRNPIETIRYE